MIVITGASGMVGREVTRALERNHDLRLVARTRWDAKDHRIVAADILSRDELAAVFDGASTVVHLAAATGSDVFTAESGSRTFTTNANGTFNVMDAARLAGVHQVILASSICAYGTFHGRTSPIPAPYTALPLTEAFEPMPEDPYSLSKLIGEHIGAAFARAHGIKVAALRLGGVWSDERFKSARATGGRVPEIWEDTLFQWVHVADVANGICLAVDAPRLPSFGVYTLSAADTTCAEPTAALVERLRPDLLGALSDGLRGRDALLSSVHAKTTFGYTPQFRIRD